MSNRNYYKGLSPLQRVYAVQAKRKSVMQEAVTARNNVVGQVPDWPKGFEYDGTYCTIKTPEAALNGYGIADDGMLRSPYGRGSVELHWQDDLDPATMLKTIEHVEQECAKIIQVMESYISMCNQVSAERMLASAGQLQAMSDPALLATRLQEAAANLLEK